VYRFLLSVRWIGFAVFVIVLAAVCTRLGFWQIHRLEHRLDQNKIITSHLKAEPVELTQALEPGAEVDDTSEFTRVRATGTYDVEHQVTVKFTTRDGAPGVDVVTPFVLSSGHAVLVDRGWQESENTVARPDVPAPPTGQVTITGWLRQNNGAGGEAIRPIKGQIRAISSVGFAKSVPYELLGGYLNLRSEDPAPAKTLAAEPEPERGQGPHFFYALQWWFFALLAVVGYFWFARSEAKERRSPTRVDGFAGTNPPR
jgi:cytochrome oxidase assembly protein ShyY1